MKVDARHLPRLLDAVYEMNRASDHADFMAAITAAMSRLIPADLSGAHVLDRKSQRILHRMVPENPFRPEEMGYYVAHPAENPLVVHFQRTKDFRARRLSDLMAPRTWHRTPFYRACLARLGYKYSLALPVAVDEHTVAALTFERRRSDFTVRHRALLDAFAPHLRLAWQRHPDPWKAVPTARPTVRARLQQLGLTPSESDILRWMMDGKQNREIATILGRSLHTVQEHVANLVRKLGQENRHAATVYALDVLREK